MTIALERLQTRYTLHEQLGVGSMGVVYHAQDRLTGQAVALKSVTVPPANLTFGSRGDFSNPLIALANEFRTLAGLRHPNIISVLDYGFDHARRPYFTMELLTEAQALAAAAQGRDLAGTLHLLMDVLQALAYLHRRGLIHRDLKPSNILVQAGRARVLDFGLAVAHDMAQGRAGTLAYMAPETLGRSVSVPQSDFYALGVIAYELFAGRLPFDPEDIAGILRAEPDLDALPVPAILRNVIGRLLQKDPRQRYDHAADIIADLSDALGHPLPAEAPHIRESFLQAAAFVGRAAQLTALTDALQAASTQHTTQLYLVAGESGVGKSRLLEETRIRALVRGALVLRGQASENTVRPYSLWAPIARWLALCLNPDDPADLTLASVLKEIAPDLAQVVGCALPDADGLPPELSRARLADVLAQLLRRQGGPLLLLLEDLQWARNSLALLQALLPLLADVPLLIVGSYRSDERPDLPDELPLARVLHLPRLGADAIAQLSSAMLGAAGQNTQVLDLLTRETEGNVFFLVEVVRALAEAVGRLEDIGTRTLPDSVFAGGMVAVVRRRLGRVPTWAQPLLRVAAVAGRTLDEAVLQHVAHTSNARLAFASWAQACQDAAVLEIVDGQWRFAHDKLRSALLADLAADTQADLHRQVALAIEAVHPDDTGYALPLQAHWHAAGDFDAEMRYLPQASEQLLRTDQTERADALLSRAAAALADDDPRRVNILTPLASTRYFAADFEGARQLALSGLHLAQQAADPGLTVRNLLTLANIAERTNEADESRHYAERALALAQQHAFWGDVTLAAIQLGVLAFNQTDYDTTRHYLALAQAASLRTNDLYNQGRVQSQLGYLALASGDYDSAEGYFHAAMAKQRRVGNRRHEANNMHFLAIVSMYRGAYDDALERTAASGALRQAIGVTERYSDTLYVRAQALRHLGRHTEALAAIQACYDIRQRYGNQDLIAWAEFGLGLVLHAAGDAAQGPERVLKARALWQHIGNRFQVVDAEATLAAFALLSHEQAQAESYLRNALTQALELTSVVPLLGALTQGAQVLLGRGQARLAVRVARFITQQPQAWHEMRVQADAALLNAAPCLDAAAFAAAEAEAQQADAYALGRLVLAALG